MNPMIPERNQKVYFPSVSKPRVFFLTDERMNIFDEESLAQILESDASVLGERLFDADDEEGHREPLKNAHDPKRLPGVVAVAVEH